MVNIRASKEEVMRELKSHEDEVSDEIVKIIEGREDYEPHSFEELVDKVLDVHKSTDVDYEKYLEEEGDAGEVAESLVRLGKIVSLTNLIKER